MASSTRSAPVSLATIPLMNDAIEDRQSSVAKIATVVATDAGLTARVLGLANSAMYGQSRSVDELEPAVALIGVETLRTIAIAGACSMLDRRSGLPEARQHAFEVAVAARSLAALTGVHGGNAFAAGLLHDIGEFLLWQEHQGEYAAVHTSWFDGPTQLHTESDLYGTDHAVLGAEHLFEWRVPEVLVDAIGDHHDPRAESALLTLVVAAADELVMGEPSGANGLGILGITDSDADDLRERIGAEADDLAASLLT